MKVAGESKRRDNDDSVAVRLFENVVRREGREDADVVFGRGILEGDVAFVPSSF